MFGDKKLAKRYVKAVTAEKKLPEIEALFAELSAVKSSLDGDLEVALNHPIIQPSDKVGLMSDLCEKMGLSDESKRFLNLLITKNRISLFESILEVISEQIDSLKKILKVEVKSAFELDKAEQEKILKRLETTFKRSLRADFSVEPGLRGGLVVTVAGVVFDVSLKSRLERYESLIFS